MNIDLAALRALEREREMRRTWRRVDADSFVVTVERKSDGDWRETQSVLYRRVR